MDDSHSAAASEYLIRYGGDKYFQAAGGMFNTLFHSARGTIVTDVNGREYLDFTSGQMSATIGHNHPAIVEATRLAGEKAFHLFSGMIPEVVAQLAETLARDWLPGQLRRSMFVSTGSESNELALRIAKLYTGGYEVLALGGSWHGITSGAGAVSILGDRRGYGVPLAGVSMIPEADMYRPYLPGVDPEESALTVLELALKMFDMQTTGQGSAIIAEPVLSGGGVIVPPQSFLAALRKAADERGMLLIFDEAQTAFGRIGARTGAAHFGVTPDIMSLSKTLGGGLPIGAVATTATIEDTIHDRNFAYYTSHVSDPLAAEVGLAVLRTLEEERLIERANEMGEYMMAQLDALQQRHDVIGDVRGLGLLIGVELVSDRATKRPAHRLGPLATEKCLAAGLNVNIRRKAERGAVWRIAPPLTVSHDEIDQAIAIIDRSLADSLDELARTNTEL
ncbi:MAG: aspartate aminotransferase family protein [Nitriliruptoraceae bacterium]